jgi:Prokaryotic membrane lipoprotein lipid attachment site
MRRTITALVLAAAVAACSNPEPARPGNPAVYERIAVTTDCVQLQKEFDRAEQNHDRTGDPAHTSYMEAAHAQMEKAGCF